MIELRTALAEMERLDRRGNLIDFKIDFVTADDQKQTGGVIMVFEKATLCFPNKSGTRKFNPKRMLERQEHAMKIGKAPEHVKNGTINIQTEGGVLTKCSIWLIRYFNGEKVVLNIHG